VTCGLFITGWNPFSQSTAPYLNRAANHRMPALFAEQGVIALPHVGRSHDGAWTEEGFFALGLSAEAGLLIAAEFDQHAIVTVSLGRPAELHLTSESVG